MTQLLYLVDKFLKGATQNMTFITGEWEIPGRIVAKDLNGRLFQFVPPVDGGLTVTVADTPDVTDNANDVVLLPNIDDICPPQVINDTPITLAPPVINDAPDLPAP